MQAIQTILQNLAPALPELKHLKIGEDKALVTALQAPRLSQEPQEAVKQVLRGIMVRLGIRAANMPTEEEKAILLHHIATHYSNHTIAEINLAFEMAISGQLDCEVNCYENFSCLYFSNIMTAYRLWAKEIYKALPLPTTPLSLPGPPLSDEELIELSRDIFKTTNNFMFIDYRCYELLKIVLPDNDKKRIKLKAAAYLAELYRYDKKISDYEILLNRTCKKIAVAEFFNLINIK